MSYLTMKPRKMSKNRPTVYVSNSYQAPGGLKGLVIDELAKYECEVVCWGVGNTEAANLIYLKQKVDMMIIIPPATRYFANSFTVGRGQRVEIEHFHRGHTIKGKLEGDNFMCVLNLDSFNRDGSILLDECQNGWEENDGDYQTNRAKVSHDGSNDPIGDYISIKNVDKLAYDGTFAAGKEVAIAHLALYGQLN
jgi:hypothetical protein